LQSQQHLKTPFILQVNSSRKDPANTPSHNNTPAYMTILYIYDISYIHKKSYRNDQQDATV